MKIQQDLIFGNASKVFSVEKLLKLSEQDKTSKDFNFTETKKYFLTFFAKAMGDARYFYEPQEEGDGLIENMTSLQMDKIMKQIPVIKYSSSEGEEAKAYKFDISKWFIEQHHTTFKISSDPRSSRFYESPKTGQKFLNLSKGFLFKNPKKFCEFPEKIRKNVQMINNHIINVWNSGNVDAGEYTLNWFSHALTGHKMETAIFLKSGEGTGKSIIIDFLIQKVIGSALGLSTSRAKQLMGFNAQLLGKVFVCLEELPASSKSEWFSISDFLKDLITGSSIDIEKKYSDIVQTTNLISLIIMTNNENTIKFGKDMRRYFLADISHDKVGSIEYFTELEKAMSKETGEAYYSWLVERYEATKNTFKCEAIPLTESKIEMKIKNLTPLLKFVKEQYLMNKTGIFDAEKKHKKLELSHLKSLINLAENKEIFKSTQSINSAIASDLPIVKTVEYGKGKTLHIEPIDFQTLMDFYIKKGFWSDKYDKFNAGEEEEPSQLDEVKKSDFKQLYEEQLNTTLALQKQIKELQEQMSKMTIPLNSVITVKPKLIAKTDDSDLDKELRELEEAEVLKTKPITKKLKKVQDDVEFEIKSSSGINDFFN